MPRDTYETMSRIGYIPGIIRREETQSISLRYIEEHKEIAKPKFNRRRYIKKKDRIDSLKHLIQNTIDGIIDKPDNSFV